MSCISSPEAIGNSVIFTTFPEPFTSPVVTSASSTQVAYSEAVEMDSGFLVTWC